jgi:thioredoxin-like negative regulator of GroEL
VTRFRILAGLLMVLLQVGSAWAGSPTTRGVGNDLHGQRWEIPTAGRPTVVIFLRPDQKQSELEIDQVSQGLLQAKQVAVLGVVSGPDAGKRAQAVGQWDWPLLADESFTLSGAFEVHAWPTTLIFDSKGKLAGRIAGNPASLKSKVAAYVAYVSGAMTRAQLDEELTRQGIVQDSGEQKAFRHLLLVQELLARGRVDEATAQLKQAHDLAPATESVRLLMARDMLLLGDAKEADAVLATLQGTSQRGEWALLCGRSAIVQGRWQEAAARLREAHDRPLGPAARAECQYWAGVVYQHDADFAHAAEAFRKAYESSRPTGVSEPPGTDRP